MRRVRSMVIHIDKPLLNKKTPEENIAIIDRWMADTADKINAYVEVTERKLNECENQRAKGYK